ncbi:MAG: VWA domain-containing protein [Prevotella sp.]|nr:VWA domain-containing protein [Bacteroides sp.]MCM1366619.1 VWA domain-containing protein [Prevotella sp.]MCM1436984.1 VWA domain-containing protein [Prevotella sp.]
MILQHKWLLLLFLIYIPLIGWYIKKQRNASPSLGISTISAFKKAGKTMRPILMHVCFVLDLIAIGCLIVALCRPMTCEGMSKSRIEGTDIVLALDISGSMAANDIYPNRFLAAKEVAEKFIVGRNNDNMGLVIFSGESLSIMPLTNDRGALINALKSVKMGALSDGTAIGDGLASAINRISSGKAKSKSIILLTDGTNNAGDVAPSTAAEIARKKGIRVYTIGAGTDGSVSIRDPYGFAATTVETKIDEESLKQIAQLTGGKYFRAKNASTLKKVFQEIDSLEKTVLDVDRYNRLDENFMPWVWAAFGAFVLMLLLRYPVLRRIP